MLRRTPIFSALDPALVSSGLAPDIHPAKAPLWVTGTGVEFVNGKVRHKKGNLRLVEASTSPVRGIIQHRLSNGEVAVWWMQGGQLWRWDQFSLQVMKSYGGLPINWPYIDFTSYGDWMFINQGIGNIEFFNGATFSVMAEMPSNVRQLRKHLSFLLALGIGTKGTGVAWSDANDISKWVPGRTNTAGALYIDEFEGGIMAGEPLGPVIAVYSENQMALVSFIGSPFYFGQKVMLTGIGAVGGEAVTAAGGLNYGVSRQGIWVNDGTEFRYIDDGRLGDYLQDNVNWAVAPKILTVRNDIMRTIEFHFPMEGSTELNEAWSFDPATKGWSKVPAVSYYTEELALGLPLQATQLGRLEKVGGQNFSIEPLLLQTKPMLMQLQSGAGLSDVHFAVKVDEVELLVHDVRSVQMRVGSSMEHDGTIHWSSYITLEQGKSTYRVPAGVPDGVYWHLEFTSTTIPTQVQEGAENVLEILDLVESITEESAWRLDMQGFMLFGAIQGAKLSA